LDAHIGPLSLHDALPISILASALAVSFYAAGSREPKKSGELMQRNGQKWSNRE
jgi:hypothetical protein